MTSEDDGIPRLADSRPFELGMTVWLGNGRAVATSAEEHEVEKLVVDGRTHYTLGRRDSHCGTDLLRLWSSRESLLKGKAGQLVQIASFLADLRGDLWDQADLPEDPVKDSLLLALADDVLGSLSL